MKTTLLKNFILLFFSLLTLKSQAQQNHYFQNTPVWKVASNCSIGGPCYRIEDFNYYTGSDTIIDFLTYVKVFQQGQGFYDWQAPFQNPGCAGNFIDRDSVPRYFLRSELRQIFIRLPGDSAEQLLYDFNLAIGDTLPITYNNYFRDIVVSGIDSILTPNGYYTRFALTGATWSSYLIEGIGHSRGFLQPLKAPLECIFTLDCFGMNDSAFYPTAGPSCLIAIGIKEAVEKIKVQVYPNPFQQSTTFTFDKSLKNVELKVHSVLGQNLSQIVAEPNGKIILERGDLKNGIFFYEILQDGKVKASGKLLIE